MIPILSKMDVELVDDPVIQGALLKEFSRLPNDYRYPEYGYFIVIESIHDLTDPIEVDLCLDTQASLTLFESIEMIEEFEGYFQVVLILEAEFGVSLFVKDDIATFNELQELLLFF